MSETATDTGKPAGLRWLNEASPQQLNPRLRGCLAVHRWVEVLAQSRPYRDVESLLARAESTARELTDDEVLAAIADHPRIGMLADSGSATAQWSANEQSGIDHADADLATALRRETQDYERRFGHIYLVCATGLDGTRVLADLRGRMANDALTELTVIRAELAEIAKLRLRKLVTEATPASTEQI